jgi:pimeloyl-ACP methyl ester carboxylesterase
MTAANDDGRRRRGVAAVTVVATLGLVLSACSSGSSPAAAHSTSTSATAVAGTLTAAQKAAQANGADPTDTDGAGVEWLCRPGQADDPCTTSLTTTVVPRSGPTRVVRASDATHPGIDCFYVYPTVSEQSGALANLHIDPAETAVARSQASRFSESCRVYAPIYPQLTLAALLKPADLTAANLATAYEGVVAAWDDYLAHYNDGRGVVVIGHSQGAAMLIALLRRQVDDDPAVRRHLVSAIILGGNVTVPIGKTVGGSFEHIPACTSTTETGCVIAYSSFDQQPPSNSLFGRPGRGVSSLSPGASTATAGLQVLCVNPASLAGGPAPLTPYFPSAQTTVGLGSEASVAPPVSTAWVTEPDLYTGQCDDNDGASWLQVSAPVHPGDTRPVVKQTIGPTWGLHLVDVNIALGNLVSLVGDEARAYTGKT